jgi:hypothetical protein
MFFQIVLREQHSVTICKVDFAYPFDPTIYVSSKQLVREAINRGDVEYLGSEAKEKYPTELQNHYYDEMQIRRKRAIYRIMQTARAVDKPIVKQPEETKESKFDEFDDAWIDQLPDSVKYLAEEERQKVIKKMAEFKLKISDDHLRVFAYRNPKKDEELEKALALKSANKQPLQLNDLYIYTLSNRKLANNMQSPVEVEVFRWDEKSNQIVELEETSQTCVDRKYNITNMEAFDKASIDAKIKAIEDDNARYIKKKKSEVKNESKDVFGMKPDFNQTRKVRRGERQYLNHFIKKPQNSGWLKTDGSNAETDFFYVQNVMNNFDGKDEKDTEFWNKMPYSFKMASDGKGRIIFYGGSRSTWVYDLQLCNGDILIWSNEDFKKGMALGMQKKVNVMDIDFIDHNFVSVLTKNKVAKWQHKTDINQLAETETLLRALPKVVKAPVS